LVERYLRVVWGIWGWKVVRGINEGIEQEMKGMREEQRVKWQKRKKQ